MEPRKKQVAESAQKHAAREIKDRIELKAVRVTAIEQMRGGLMQRATGVLPVRNAIFAMRRVHLQRVGQRRMQKKLVSLNG